ncbi:MAG: hypothetical protein ABSB49_08625 [Polyangia bacterium]
MARSLPLLAGFLALAGCLEAGPPPTGTQLFHSQTLEQPGFLQVASDWYALFVNRLSLSTASHGGVYDLWLSSFDGKAQRKMVANLSDHWTWPPYLPSQWPQGGGYFMVDERAIPSGVGSATVGSWVHLSATLDEDARVEDVATTSTFSAPLSWIYANPNPGLACPGGFPLIDGSCPQAIFERPAPVGQSLPTLYLWDGSAQIPIGSDAGGFATWISGTGSIYCILGDAHTWSRLRRPSNQLDSLRANVSSFTVSGDEHYAALTVTDGGTPKTVLKNLLTGSELTPAEANPSAWLGFSGDSFFYAENATASAPAELHQLDPSTGLDTFAALPAPLTNFNRSAIARPNTDEVLRTDNAGHGVFTGASDLIPRRAPLTGPLWSPAITPDGVYVIYLERGKSTIYNTDAQGALMFQECDHPEHAPVKVSPEGLLLDFQSGSPYFFVAYDSTSGAGVFAFWAHLGSASPDLYFADYQAGAPPTDPRLVAQSIMSVSVSQHSLFGIVNVSEQDGVGDLVLRNLDTGTDFRYAQGVSEAAQSPAVPAWVTPPLIEYIVRGRVDADRSGLWLANFAPPDAGMN